MEFEAVDGFSGVVGRRRDFKPHDERENNLVVSFMEYRGRVPPSNSLGNAGDIYIDNVAFMLYACYDFAGVKDRWYAWSSTKFDGPDILEHPEHRDSILWVNGEASWWRRRRLENRFGKKRFLKTPNDFVRDFLQKTQSKGKSVKNPFNWTDADNGSGSYSASRVAPTTAPPVLGRGTQPISQPYFKHSLPPIQTAVSQSQPVEPLIGLEQNFGGEDGGRLRLDEEIKVLKRKVREVEEENGRLRNALSQSAIRTNESERMAFPSPPPSAHLGLSQSRSVSVAYSPALSVKHLPPQIPTTSKKTKRALLPPIITPTPCPVPLSSSPSLELRRFPTPPPPECPASPELLGPPLDRIFTPSPPPSSSPELRRFLTPPPPECPASPELLGPPLDRIFTPSPPPSSSPELRRFLTPPPPECRASPELLGPPLDRIFTPSPPSPPECSPELLGPPLDRIFTPSPPPSPSLVLQRFGKPPPPACSPELLGPPLDRIFTPSPPPCPSPKVAGNPLGEPTLTPSVPWPWSPVLETGLKTRRIAWSGGKGKGRDKVKDLEKVMPAASQSRRRRRRRDRERPILPSVSHSSFSPSPADSAARERHKRKKRVNPPLPAVSTSARLQQKTCTPHRTNPGAAAFISVKIKEEPGPIRQPLSGSSASVEVHEVIDLTMDSDDETTTKPKVIVAEDSDDEIQEVENPKGKENSEILPDGAEGGGMTPLTYSSGTSRDVSMEDISLNIQDSNPEMEYEPEEDPRTVMIDTVKVKVELSEAEQFPLSHYPPERLRPLLVGLMYTEYIGKLRCAGCMKEGNKAAKRRDWRCECVLAKLHHFKLQHPDDYDKAVNLTEEGLRMAMVRQAQVRAAGVAA